MMTKWKKRKYYKYEMMAKQKKRKDVGVSEKKEQPSVGNSKRVEQINVRISHECDTDCNLSAKNKPIIDDINLESFEFDPGSRQSEGDTSTLEELEDNDDTNTTDSGVTERGEDNQTTGNHADNVDPLETDMEDLRDQILGGSEDVLNVYCCNCKREGPGILLNEGNNGSAPGSELAAYVVLHVKEVPSDEVLTRRKFCHLRKASLGTATHLCWQCWKVVCCPVSDIKGRESLYQWCSFLWGYLRDSNASVSIAEWAWKALPKLYRCWWLLSVRSHLYNYEDFTISQPEAITREATLPRYSFGRTFEDLRAVPLFQSFDQFCAMPLVKCPWSCSEFLNRCNRIPIDALLLRALDTDSRKFLHMSGQSEAYLEGVRSDFMTATHDILCNPNWPCRPTICFDVSMGPQFLCCRFHSKRTKGKMIHVPTHPLGNIASKGDNQFAAAVPRPRSVGSSRRKQFTDSYQLTVAHGGFEGVDSMILSDVGQMDKCTFLSSLRDGLSLQMRPDVSAHISRLVERGSISISAKECLEEFASHWFPEDQLGRIANSDYGGSYVTMETSMRVDAALRNEALDSVLDLSTNRTTKYRPSWNKHIFYVHGNDGYGSPFPWLPHFPSNLDIDYRFLWLLLSIVTSSENLWLMIAQGVRTTSDWQGWFLAYATKHCFIHLRLHGSKNNPFSKVKSPQEMTKFLFETVIAENDISHCDACARMIDSIPDACAENWADVYDKDINIPDDAKIFLLSNDITYRTAESVASSPVLELGDWELCMIASTWSTGDGQFTGSTYSRHGQVHGCHWWLRNHCVSGRKSMCQPVKVSDEEFNTYLTDAEWDVALYVKMSSESCRKATMRYLEYTGFDTTIRCAIHKDPLVPLVPAKLPTLTIQCILCAKKASIGCSGNGCDIGLCQGHYKEQKRNQETSNGNIVFLGEEPNEQIEFTSSDDCSTEDSNGSQSSMSSSGVDENDLLNTEMEEEHFFLLDQPISNCRNSDVEISDQSLESSDSSVDSFDCERKDPGQYDDQLNHCDSTDSVEAFASDSLSCTRQKCVGQNDNLILYNRNDDDFVLSRLDEEASFQTIDTDRQHDFPTTLSHGNAYNFSVHSEYVGSHVIFNKVGKLLIRQSKVLSRNLRQKHWIQKIMSTLIHRDDIQCSVPLVYAEGTIFPSIFWMALRDGSIMGAMPTALLADNATLRRYGFATLHDHMRTRLMDTSSLCSTDNSYMQYALDACVNLGTRGQDTRLHMRRGWDPMLTKGEGIRLQEGECLDDTMFNSEQIDNKVICNKVAAALNRKMGTFFYTYTLNQSMNFGTRILKSYLDDDSTVLKVASVLFGKKHDLSFREIDQLRGEILDSSATLALRVWENVWHVLRQYLMESPEKPLGGTPEHIVDRTELQDGKSSGNLPHHHLIIWLKEDDGSYASKSNIVQKIRGSISAIVDTEEIQGYLQDGTVSSFDELISKLESLERFLPHRHTKRCLVPNTNKNMSNKGSFEAALTSTGEVDVDELLRQGYKCKVPDNHKITSDPNEHVFRKIQRPHCQKAKEIFMELGLLKTSTNIHGVEYEELDDRLVAVTHIPPTTAENGVVSPVISRLALLNPGNSNVQYLDSILAARYLTKYVIMMDESNRIWMRAPKTTDPKTIQCTVEHLPNTKITSVSADLKDKDDKEGKRKKNYIARIVGAPEVAMLLLNMAQVYLTFEFVHIATVPMEERPAFDRTRPIDKLISSGVVPDHVRNHAANDLDSNSVIFSHMARRDWGALRQFAPSALIQAKDLCYCPLSTDSVTIFSMRPPELYWIRHQQVYHECFVRSHIRVTRKNGESYFEASMEFCKKNITARLDTCLWVDATFSQIKLRRAALPRLIQYIDRALDVDFVHIVMPNFRSLMRSMLQKLHAGYHISISPQGFRTRGRQATWLALKQRFLCHMEQGDIPVGYFSNIRPTLANRFIIHILLSMGKFTTELDLQLCGDVRAAYEHAELFDPNNAEESVRDLLLRYVTEQMPACTFSTKNYDASLLAAKEAFHCMLIDDTVPQDKIPPVLYARLTLQCEESTKEFSKCSHEVLAGFLVRELGKCGIPNLPDPASLIDMTLEEADNPLWSVDEVLRSANQSLNSYQEQFCNLQQAKLTFHLLASEFHKSHPKCICTVGGPGCGKTVNTLMMLLHAMSMGLRCATTALLSERAAALGGIHFHRLFSVPVVQTTMMSGAKLAEKALAQLFQSGQERMHFLQGIDVLFIDELGNWAAVYLTVIDIILRRLRNSNLIFGGVLIVATYDILQLFPINSMPPLFSGHMMTSFRFLELNHSVRASGDPLLQELQSLTRLATIDFTMQKRERFVEIFTQICTFVPSFEDPRIPSDTVYCFGKKSPGRKRRDELLAKYDGDIHVTKVTAFDEQCTKFGSWHSASEHTATFLDARVKEDKILYFGRGMVYEITEFRKDCYNSHQLCMLWDVPEISDIENFSPVSVLLAPAGSEDLPSVNEFSSKEGILNMEGWKEVKVHACRQSVHTMAGGQRARRKQYCLRLRVTSTLHSAMGNTVSSICTRVESEPGSDYHLWERAQVIVLLSRTRLGKNMFFVTENPVATARALIEALMTRSQYTVYMENVLKALLHKENEETTVAIDLSQHVYRPIDVQLPTNESGFVYMIVSLQQENVTYIGETAQLLRRLEQHNGGSGAMQTQSPLLRPWALICFVAGFDYNVVQRKTFEKRWQHGRDGFRTRNQRNPTCQDIVNIGGQLVHHLSDNDSWPQLTLVVCGKTGD